MQGVFFPPGAIGCRDERRWQVFREVSPSSSVREVGENSFRGELVLLRGRSEEKILRE